MAKVQGCLSAAVWERANETTISTCRISGALEASNGAPARWVVDAHVSGDDAPIYFVVPLEADGLPAAPFRYDGDAHSLLAIAAEKGRPFGPNADPFASKRVYRATLARAAERSPTQSSSYRRFGGDGCCDEHFTAPTWESENGVIVAAFRRGPGGQFAPAEGKRTGSRIGADGQPIPADWNSNDRGPADIVWPADCAFVVIPASQPRPQREVVASQAGAALLTPLTVCADVGLGIVILPLALLMLASGITC
jgi:hypothetical protein